MGQQIHEATLYSPLGFFSVSFLNGFKLVEHLFVGHVGQNFLVHANNSIKTKLQNAFYFICSIAIRMAWCSQCNCKEVKIKEFWKHKDCCFDT